MSYPWHPQNHDPVCGHSKQEKTMEIAASKQNGYPPDIDLQALIRDNLVEGILAQAECAVASRDRLMQLLNEAAVIVNEAMKVGLTIRFGFTPNPETGELSVTPIKITREF
jgi:hypothetical protein